jgi:hypothetical protein
MWRFGWLFPVSGAVLPRDSKRCRARQLLNESDQAEASARRRTNCVDADRSPSRPLPEPLVRAGPRCRQRGLGMQTDSLLGVDVEPACMPLCQFPPVSCVPSIQAGLRST